MKKYLTLFALSFLLFTHSSFAGFYGLNSVGVALKEALKMHYKCNDNAANTTVTDSTDTYNMTATVNTSTISTTGRVNQGFDIDGASGRRASIADQTALRLDEFSVGVWVYYGRTAGVASSFVREAESYNDAVGTDTTYLSRTCVQVTTAMGAGYVMTYPISQQYERGGISFFPTVAIPVKPGTNTLIGRIEIWDNSLGSIVQSDDFYSNDFTGAAAWYEGYQFGGSVGRWLTGSENYSIRIYSYGNLDFYLDRFYFDIYHNCPFGKANDWAFWANGCQFRVNVVTGGTKQSDAPAPTYNEWTFYVGTFSKANQQIKIYRNGALADTDSIGGAYSINWTTNGIYVGAKSTGVNEQFFGDVDNAMFFNKVLTPNEVMYLYNAGVGTEGFA